MTASNGCGKLPSYVVFAGAHGRGMLTPTGAWTVTLTLFEETLVANGCGKLQCGWRTDEVGFFGALSNSMAFLYRSRLAGFFLRTPAPGAKASHAVSKEAVRGVKFGAFLFLVELRC